MSNSDPRRVALRRQLKRLATRSGDVLTLFDVDTAIAALQAFEEAGATISGWEEFAPEPDRTRFLEIVEAPAGLVGSDSCEWARGELARRQATGHNVLIDFSYGFRN